MIISLMLQTKSKQNKANDGIPQAYITHVLILHVIWRDGFTGTAGPPFTNMV